MRMETSGWTADAIIGVYTVVVSAVVGGLGFGGKIVWDHLTGASIERTRQRVERIDVLLKFYYDVMVRLKREQSIWDKLVACGHAPSDEIRLAVDSPHAAPVAPDETRAFVQALDEVNLRHHRELQSAIIGSIVEARPRPDMLALFLQYDEHVTLYATLREMGRSEFPSALGSPYPRRLLELTRTRIRELEDERDARRRSRWWLLSQTSRA